MTRVQFAMELLFRKHFWAVNALFILLASWIFANAVNLFVESALSPVASAAPTPSRRNKMAPPSPKLDLPRLAKLTGLPLPVEPDVKEPERAADMNAAPVRTSLRARLLGTLVSGSPEWSLASIEDLNAQKSQTYMVHDKVMGAEILSIDRNQVIILNGGHKEFISADTGDGAGAPVPANAFHPPVAVAEPGTAVTGSGIRSTGENSYEVPRQEIDKTLSNLNDVAMQARIVPAFKDGQAEGFKLFSIRPDSIYTHIGVQNGDVIRRINGYDMNSPEKALEVYSKLKDANQVDIEIDRNGTILHKTYNIR